MTESSMLLRFERSFVVWDGKRAAIHFIGRDGDRAVQCFVPLAALQRCFDLTAGAPIELLKIFRKNAPAIHRAADRKYRAVGANTRGQLFLNAIDLL
jgi:Protein of unknown function (DUF1488)